MPWDLICVTGIFGLYRSFPEINVFWLRTDTPSGWFFSSLTDFEAPKSLSPNRRGLKFAALASAMTA